MNPTVGVGESNGKHGSDGRVPSDAGAGDVGLNTDGEDNRSGTADNALRVALQ